MTRLAISGAAGRMGQRITTLACQDDRFTVTAGFDLPEHSAIGQDIGELAGIGSIGQPLRPVSDGQTGDGFDVLIDFSLPEGTMAALDLCLASGRAVVIGTTGHAEDQLERIAKAAQTIPVLHAPNMSVAMNVMFRIAGQVAAALGDEYDCEVVESHHRFKADAPSGSAMELLRQVCKATNRDPRTDAVYGRQGRTGERARGQIGMHALRVGDTVGEHDVHFGCLGETLVLRHVAHTRDTFVYGALRAAAWIGDKPIGLYSMQDVLFGEGG